MTSIAAPHAAVRTTPRRPRSFASVRATLGRPFRIFAAAAELERQRTIDDPHLIMGLVRD